jgi:hypothetical protein
MSTNLSRTTSFVRKSAVVLVIAIIIITIIQMIWGVFTIPLTGPTTRPTDSVVADGCPAPIRTFGKLTPIKLKSLTLEAGTKASFSTDISTKKFPTFYTSLYVYKLGKIYEKLDDVDRATATAELLGFTPSTVINSPLNVSWQITKNNKIFTFDKANHKWELTNDITKVLLTKLPQTQETFPTIAQNILKAIKLSNTNYAYPKITYELVIRKFDKSLQNTTDITTANLLRITAYKGVDLVKCKLKNGGEKTYTADIYSPEYLDQSFSALVTGDGQDLKTKLINLKIREFEISKTEVAVYPAKTMDEAFTDLQANKGFLYWIIAKNGNIYATYKEHNVKSFLIEANKTEIVYIEPQEYIDDDISTHFILPYYKFIGTATIENDESADFVFLVPAIKSTEFI